MGWNKKNRLVFGLVGLLLVIFALCGFAAKKMGLEASIHVPEKETEVKVETMETTETMEVTEVAETMEAAASTEKNKPVGISSEQFIKLVADYHKDWKYKGAKPCVVDFYADWCRPCKMMEPAFAKLAEKYAGKINFYKVNIDYNKELSEAYKIVGIPTLFFCSANGKLTRVVGYQTEEQITANLELILQK